MDHKVIGPPRVVETMFHQVVIVSGDDQQRSFDGREVFVNLTASIRAVEDLSQSFPQTTPGGGLHEIGTDLCQIAKVMVVFRRKTGFSRQEARELSARGQERRGLLVPGQVASASSEIAPPSKGTTWPVFSKFAISP
jgi:hypothetical protein